MGEESAQAPDVTTPAEGGEDLKVESHDPAVPEAYAAFMRTGWADVERELPPHPVVPWAEQRRARLAEAFPGERLVLPAGTFKVRSNDTDYRFRPDTAHTYFSGNQTTDAVLVVTDGEPVLYARPRSGRDTDEFFRDRQYGALWAGERPSLRELEQSLGLPVRHRDELAAELARTGTKTRVLRGLDAEVDAGAAPDEARDAELARVASELRLVKDTWEVDQLQEACDITTLGFEDSVREWDRVREHGERWLEGTFFRRARAMGNDLGYDSIVGAGSHATTLHWIDNTGPVLPGQLILLDMGVENRNLYTADVTRTLPVDGTFTPLQRDLYELVLAAQQAGIDAVRPGVAFTSVHQASMTVLAHGLGDLGLLPCSPEEALSPDSRVYARWTLHGTSHMLGMDVHDCARSAPEVYPRGDLAEGMVLTVEPGLYFQADDLLVPEELRGIGIRIEDDVLVTADGARNLSAALPRTVADVEAWMGSLLP
ncbi:aminopeptidase P family protein [Nocardioides sp. ChNu-153]|uniref:aminopeptidase P family protein n=1 Tax=unclassified Nocardioides TaxID=2615069 RepID=UPI0024063C20|nr:MULTISPECIES: aminopeptidase P family protein [unclassified Nocardioides]MDF9716361.1 aminopeptidase P family protein [Nocardioides sp. ChNu-99]MDN7122867.1 aminopeptidase P family protein [Nocardioides sp. ChNu-153]